MEPWVWTAVLTAIAWLFLQLSGGEPNETDENVKVKIEARISQDCEQDPPQEPCDGPPDEGRHPSVDDGLLPPPKGMEDKDW